MNIIRGPQQRAQRVILYGQEGVGKSTYISRLPQVLFLDTEEGTQRLNVDRVPVRNLTDLRDAVKELLQESKDGRCSYRVIAIDTADRLWDMCADAVCEANGWASIESPGFGKGMKMATEKFLSLMKGLDLLVEAGINVALICHCKVERLSPPDLPEYTMYQPKISAPGKQAEETKEKLKQWCDMLLFARFETIVSSKDGKAGKAVGGEVKRLIETQHTSFWEAKCRGDLPSQLPMDNADALAAALGLAPAPSTPASAAAIPASQEVTGEAAAVPPGESRPPEISFTARAASTPAAQAPSPAATPSCDMARGENGEPFFFAEEQKMLVDFFTAKGTLKPGQTLSDLPPNVASALKARPRAALEKAALWVAANTGKGVAA